MTRRTRAALVGLYSDVSVDLSLDDPYVDLLEKRLDVAIRLGNLADSSLIAQKLCTVAMILCASPTYLQNNGVPQTLDDLAKHNCLVYSYAMPQSAWYFDDRNGNENIARISGRFLASSTDAVLALALGNAGVALAPDYLVEDDLPAA